jgi:precorrin-3B synthase
VHELPGWVDALPGLQPVPHPERPEMPLGRVAGHASLQVPLGFLAPEQLAAVAAVAGDGPVVVTPWRGLVVARGAAGLETLTATGLVTDSTSPWTAISACVGGPWCANGRVDTQSLVRSVAGLDAVWPRTHVSGCERRCGAPAAAHHDLVAPSRDELLALTQRALTHA